MIPAGAHPVTETISPTANGASIPDAKPNLIAPEALVTDAVCIEETLSLKTAGVSTTTKKLWLSVAVGLVPTEQMHHHQQELF